MMIIISEHKKLMETGKENHTEKQEKPPERPTDRRGSSPVAVTSNTDLKPSDKHIDRHASFSAHSHQHERATNSSVPSTHQQHEKPNPHHERTASFSDRTRTERTLSQ